jgi:hypothetical protein
MERVGLRLQLRKRQAERGDIILLYVDGSEALAASWRSRGGLARAGTGASQEGRDAGVARSPHRPNHCPYQPTKPSSDFIFHLEQLDNLYGPQPGRQAKPIVLVEDNSPIHPGNCSLAALASAPTSSSRWRG